MATCLLGLAGFLWWARQSVPGLPAVWWGLTFFFMLRAGQTVPRALQQLALAGSSSSTAAAADQQQQLPAVEPA